MCVPKKKNCSEKLVNEVKESLKEFKEGKYFKGTAEEVIMKLHDEANKDKKIRKEVFKDFYETSRIGSKDR